MRLLALLPLVLLMACTSPDTPVDYTGRMAEQHRAETADPSGAPGATADGLETRTVTYAAVLGVPMERLSRASRMRGRRRPASC